MGVTYCHFTRLFKHFTLICEIIYNPRTNSAKSEIPIIAKSWFRAYFSKALIALFKFMIKLSNSKLRMLFKTH